jgi:amidase
MINQHTRRDVLATAATAMALRAIPPPAALAAEAAAQAAPDAAGTSNTLAYRSTHELVAMLVARQVSAVELLNHSMARIEALDPRINAVVVRDFERAHADAVAADAALARGERRPLLGVPMTVKEAYNVAGLPTSWGIPSFKDWRPAEDAVAVARLKAAGAVILGKTNIPTALSDWQSYNEVYGTTNNPWDLARTPGGSSGGSAAALAAGYVSLELGSDLGGSIRVPAHFCGVCGHKPTYGVVSYQGHQLPKSDPSSFRDLAVAGPLARSAADLALALDVIAGPDEPDAIAFRLALPPARHSELKDFRVLVIDTHPLEPTSSTLQAALERLADRLAKAGVKVGRSSPVLPDLAAQARTYSQLVGAWASPLTPLPLYHQLETVTAALPSDDDSLRAWRLRGLVMANRDWLAADQPRFRLKRQWHELFREWDVVLCPPGPTVAFAHDHNPDFNARRLEIDGKPFPSYIDLRNAGMGWHRHPAGVAGDSDADRPFGNGPADWSSDRRSSLRGSHDARICCVHGTRIRRLRASAAQGMTRLVPQSSL